MATITYSNNPARGCGKKKPNGFYGEGGLGSGGMLNAFVWVLGDGIEGEDNPTIAVPPRRMVFGNFPASLIYGEYIAADLDIGETKNNGGYMKLAANCGEITIFDHVGSVHYSAKSMANEVMRLGPSRRTTPVMAKQLAAMVPIPLIFTHSRIPLFRSLSQRDAAIDLVKELWPDWAWENKIYSPTYTQPDFGFYGEHANGENHYMVEILEAVHILDKEWITVRGEEKWKKAKKFFANVNFVEQVFGATWLTRVAYTMPIEGDPHPAAKTAGVEWIES